MIGGLCEVGAQGATVRVKDFGAVCDGISDDTRSIQRALDSGATRVQAPAAVCRTGTLSIPSNTELFGEGWSTIFLLRDAVAGPVIVVGDAAINVVLRDFKISANSKNQTPSGRSSGISVYQGARRAHIENVWVDDVADWGFHVNGSDVVLRRTRATNVTGARGENAVRAGYLIGTGVPPVEASRVTIDEAEVIECSMPHVNGFMLERGVGIVLQRSRALGCSWTCFKIKSDRTVVLGNKAIGCGVGFQTQGPLKDLTLTENVSSNNNGPGFLFNQVSDAKAARNWNITYNQARNNGQPPRKSTTYGFAFENVPGARTEAVLILGNEVIDDQPLKTQHRGISFGNHGRYVNVRMSRNVAQGNQVDYFLGPSVDLDSLSEAGNVGTRGVMPLKASR